MGSVPERARLGHGPRGLQRRRRRVGLLPARPRPVPRLPLERGRDGGRVGRVLAAVPGPGAVERQGPDPQGADVRADRTPRGTTARTRRTTGGTWTRSRRAPGSAGATTTRRPRSRTRTSCGPTARAPRLEPEYELLDTGVFDDGTWIVGVDYAKAAPDDILMRITVRNAGPGGGDAPRAADAVVPQHLVVGRRHAEAHDPRGGRRAAAAGVAPGAGRVHPRAGRGAGRRPADGARVRERDERRSACSASRRARRTPRTASTTT